MFFFEVKTRHSKNITDFPIEFSINEKKRRNLKKICQIYLIDRFGRTNPEWQVDAIFIKMNEAGEYKIDHLPNILWESYY